MTSRSAGTFMSAFRTVASLSSKRPTHTHAPTNSAKSPWAIRDTIREEFGKDSPEFQRHAYFAIDDGPRTVRMDFYGGGGGDWEAEDQQRFACRDSWCDRSRRGSHATTQGEKSRSWRADIRAASCLPELQTQRRDRCCRSGPLSWWAYPQAVFEAGKAFVALVKVKAGTFHIDCVPLMQTVFSANNPILAFNNLADQSDRDEQQGMMHLYTGAVMAIRNPGGHRVAVIEQPDRALQHLDLLSYLADRLDDSKKIK
jgi:uncharacterized protein (TIGR02391 family)